MVGVTSSSNGNIHCKARIIAFPFAGAAEFGYQKLALSVPEEINWISFHHSDLDHDHDWSSLIENLVEALKPYQDGTPLFLFGHSFGALMVLEICHRLRRYGGQQPLGVFLSACPAPIAPHTPSSNKPALSSLSDEEFWHAVQQWGYFPHNALDDKELASFAIPRLRSDIRLYETYQVPPEFSVDVPCVIFGGRDDHSVSAQSLAEWANLIAPACRRPTELFEGGHFYFYEEPARASLVASITAYTRQILNECPVSLIGTPLLAAQRPSILSNIRARFAQSPDAIGIYDGMDQWTHRDLETGAARVATQLTGAGVLAGDAVGVLLPNGTEYTLAILGAWSIGASICLLEKSWPDTLLAEFIVNCGIKHLLTVASLHDRALKVMKSDEQCSIVPRPDQYSEPLSWQPIDNAPHNTAFISLTSGSTGKPRAVLTTHEGCVYCFEARHTLYPYTADEREGLSVFFAWECLRALMSGQPSVIISDDVLLDPPRLLGFLAQERVTRLVVTPSLLESVLDFPGLADKFAQATSHMSAWFLMGEVVPPRLIDKAARCFAPQVRLINAYSTWESLDVSYAQLWPHAAVPRANVPAGHALPGCLLGIFDEGGDPVPMGVVGELYIGTPALGPGYLDDELKTQEKFLPAPMAFRQKGYNGHVYKTGDRARLLADGQLSILGRMDDTVKIRGFKVSLQTIERVLDAVEGVGKTIVIPINDPQSQQPTGLIAYAVGKDGAPSDTTIARLQQQARIKLPEYAVPTHFIGLQAFPLRGNGSRKLDKAALPVPSTPAPSAAAPATDHTGVVRHLAQMWCEVLRLDAVRLSDNFFDLGGNSLTAAKLVGLLSDRFGLAIAVVDVYQYSTLAALADHCRGLSTPQSPSSPPSRHDDAQATGHHKIAIVGMAGRFPGAQSIEAFWQNLVEGVDSLRHFTPQALRSKGLDAQQLAHADWVSVGQVLDDADMFDAPFFGVGPREAVLMDPQQRLFMETAHAALEQAGYARSDNPYRQRTSVFASCGIDGYLVHHLEGGGLKTPLDPGRLMLTEIGNEKDYIASRVAFQLDLGGPAISVGSACSSALVAVVQAAQSILSGQCDMAVAGACALTFPNFGFCHEEGLVGSVDGRVRPFDAQASGTLFGDAVGAVVLKRLDLAEADGDLILAQLIGVGMSNDGRMKAGYTAPNAQAQSRCIVQALEMANVQPAQLSYVECHATATLIGDAIELKGLTDAFHQATGALKPKAGSCALGSVKGNIGHANCAAGITGLIKTVMQMQHRLLTPIAHFDTLNPKLVPFVEHDQSPFTLQRELAPWDVADPQAQLPRRAGVSSFGIGGTNAHVVLEEAPSLHDEPVFDGRSRDRHLLTVSAKSREALARHLLDLAESLDDQDPASVPCSAYTLHVAREAYPLRVAVSVGTNPREARETLRQQAAELPADTPRAQSGATVAFCFSGQGSQHVGMARALYDTHAEMGRFSLHFDEVCQTLARHLNLDIAALILRADEVAMNRPIVTQCGLFAVEYALAAVLADYGIRPIAVAGHSIGQYAAAIVAGALTLEQASVLVAARATATEQLNGFTTAEGTIVQGGMMAVSGNESLILTWLESQRDVWLAVRNAPGTLVIAGLATPLAMAEQALVERGCICRSVPVSHPFHTPLMKPVADALLSASIAGHHPKLPMACNVSGAWLDERATSPAYWAEHLLAPVRWSENVQALMRWEPDVILEIGPGTVLCGLIGKCIQGGKDGGKRPRTMSSLPKAGSHADEVRHFSEMLGQLWCAGVPLDWQAYHHMEAAVPGQRLRRRVLPTYRFDRISYWTRPDASIYVAETTATQLPAAPQWLESLTNRQHAQFKLYCFPYAGGSSRSFASWASQAPHWLDVVAVEWPGRNARAEEALAQHDDDDAQARHDIAQAIRVDAGALPVVFCGMSYGATAAMDILSADLHPWTQTGQVKGLVVIGRAPMHEPVGPKGDLDSYLLASDELRQDPVWQEIFYPLLKADLDADMRAADRVAARWAANQGRPLLSLPLQVHGGDQDPAFDWRLADGWSRLSSATDAAGMQHHVYAGGHDFMLRREADILDSIINWLRPQRSSDLVPPAPTFSLQWPLCGVSESAEAMPWTTCMAGHEAAAADWLSSRLTTQNSRVALLCQRGAFTDAGAAQCVGFVQLWQTLMSRQCQGSLHIILPSSADSGPIAGAARVAGAEYEPLAIQLAMADDHPDLQATDNQARWVEQLISQIGAQRAEPWLWRRQGRVHVPRLQPFQGASLPPGMLGTTQGNYLITGGGGGLGQALMDWLIDEQAVAPERIVVMQRRSGIGYRGVRTFTVDISDTAALDAALHQLSAIEGIFHLAGVLDDGVIDSMDSHRIHAALRPKQALAGLLAHTERLKTAWAVAFSSTSALLGVPGQANYAAANAWLDHLACWPARPPHTTVVSIQWGSWGETGMSTRGDKALLRASNDGEHPMSTHRALAALGTVIAGLLGPSMPSRLFTVCDVDWMTSPWHALPILENVVHDTLGVVLTPSGDRAHPPAMALPEAPSRSDDPVRAFLGEYLPHWDDRLDLNALGMDSLDLAQLRNGFFKRFGKQVPLSMLASPHIKAGDLASRLRDIVASDAMPTT